MKSSVSQTISFAQIRNNAETINATFDFVRMHRKTLFKSVMLRAFPLLLITNLLYIWLTTFDRGVESGTVILQVLVLLGAAFLGQSMLIAIVHGFAKLADTYRPGEFDESDVWVEAKALFGKVLGTNLVLGLILLFGVGGMAVTVARIPFLGPSLLFVVVFLVIVSWSLYYPARFLEGSSFSEAFTLSRYLVSGRWWATAGLLCLWWLLLIILTFLFSLSTTLLDLVVAGYMPISTISLREPWFLALRSIITLVSMSLWSFLYAFPMFGLIFHFYSQLERKDGAGLSELAETIGEEIVIVEGSQEASEGGLHNDENPTDA